MLELWLASAAHRVSNCIADGSRHCQARAVDVLDPHALGSTEATSPVLGLSYLAAHGLDSSFLHRSIGLVVICQLFGLDLIVFIQRNENDSRVANVAGSQLVTVEKSRSKGCSR